MAGKTLQATGVEGPPDKTYNQVSTLKPMTTTKVPGT